MLYRCHVTGMSSFKTTPLLYFIWILDILHHREYEDIYHDGQQYFVVVLMWCKQLC